MKIKEELLQELKKIDKPITPDEVRKAKNRIAGRRYRKRNRSQYNAYQKSYRDKNKEKIKEARDLKNQRIADLFNESVK